MKVIDLLNKIANGEEVPKKIKVYEVIYTLDEDSLNYMDEDNKNDWLAFIDGNELTTYEVEIIEKDKKKEENKEIEGLWITSSGLHSGEMSNGYEEENLKDIVKHNFNVIHNKINEIIDVLKEMREDKE